MSGTHNNSGSTLIDFIPPNSDEFQLRKLLVHRFQKKNKTRSFIVTVYTLVNGLRVKLKKNKSFHIFLFNVSYSKESLPKITRSNCTRRCRPCTSLFKNQFYILLKLNLTFMFIYQWRQTVLVCLLNVIIQISVVVSLTSTINPPLSAR